MLDTSYDSAPRHQNAHLVDLALAGSCAAGDPSAIAELERRFGPLLDAIAFRLGASSTVAAEAKQILRCRLLVAPEGQLPRIASYSGQGPLAAWLAIAASRVLWRLLQQSRRRPDETAALACIVYFGDPEVEHCRNRSAEEFSRAFAEAVASLDDEDRRLLRANLLEHRSIDSLGEELGLHRSTVARRLERLRTGLCERTKAILADRLLLSAPEVQSFVRLAIEGMPSVAL